MEIRSSLLVYYWTCLNKTILFKSDKRITNTGLYDINISDTLNTTINLNYILDTELAPPTVSLLQGPIN